jgi:glyoxylase-like metal-dependent hydrolase (beta-lactamase superfamily II)
VSEALPGVQQIELPMHGNPVRSINAYLLEGPDGHVLIDCGWDTQDGLEALTGGLKRLGLALASIHTLVVTHFHSDHYGLAGTLRRLVRPRLLMHRLDWQFVLDNADQTEMQRVRAAWLDRHGLPSDDVESWRTTPRAPRFTVVEPDVLLDDGDEIPLREGGLQVVWTPGHTPGHICLFDADRRAVWTGDHILRPITPNISVHQPAMGNPLGAYLSSLHKTATLSAEHVLPAHGHPFVGLQQRIDELLEHHNHREGLILDALAAGPRSATAVATELPWTRHERRFADLPLEQRRMAVTETIAHLDELAATGRVSWAERDGHVEYSRGAAD